MGCRGKDGMKLAAFYWREAALLSLPPQFTDRGGLMIAWFRCFVRNHHNPVRHPLGGFKCADCGEAGADLEQMGFTDSGYVLPVRRIFSREKGEFTRTASWEPSGRGW
jgi:hypothetical protein